MFNGSEEKKGFTLIELMIVVAVIALLVLVLVPRIGLIKDKSREAGIRENMVTLEGTIHAVIDDYPATAAGVTALEARIQRDLNSVNAVNQRMRNPVTGNPDQQTGTEEVCYNYTTDAANIANGAVMFATNDNNPQLALNDPYGSEIDNVWGDPSTQNEDIDGSAGNVAFAAFVNQGVTPPRINVRLIPFGVNNIRIVDMEKTISQ